jgi:DNA mismatch repair protein MutS2
MTIRNASHDFEHAARVLALDDALALVAANCVNAGAKRAVAALRPTADAAVIHASLEEIDEYRRMREQSGDLAIPDTGYRDAVTAIARGDRGAGETLRRVADGERAVSVLRRGLAAGEGSFARLRAIAAAAVAHDALVDEADRALEADGSVKDGASPALKAIRRDIRAARTALRERAEKLVGDLGADSHSTMMGGRHVLVVPRGKVRKGSGLVHGASQTGGSLYLEPVALLELNNELETRLADETEEIQRILAALSETVRRLAPEILANADAIERLDGVRARAAFAERFGCVAPEVSTRGRLRLVRARHPLLTLALERAGALDRQVPLDLTLEPSRRVLVITGPNAGGKTVAIKTVGLSVLLLQCGLPVPCAHGSELPVFDQVFADIGDEQSMESSLSTFTSHLGNLDEMSRRANAGTLCLIDEIGDGTDPDEGAAIAVATLERLLASKAAVIASTHYGRIKTFALETDGVANASMAFEDEAARPLYRLLEGIAGRSRGIDTARRVGFDPAVVERAQQVLGSESFRLEAALARLEESFAALERERATLSAERAELERVLAASREKERSYSLTKKEASRRALREAEEMLAQTRRDIEEIVRSLRERGADRGVIRESRARVEKLMDDVRLKAEPEASATPLARAAVGDRVSLSPTGAPSGVVVEVDRKDAVVEIGGKRVRARIGRLYAAAAGPEAAPRAEVHVQYEPVAATEVSVRGMDRESAVEEVSRFVDRALLTGLHEVKIVHGLGEGILGRAVREFLSRDPRVATVRPGDPMEGGMGVTFATLR